MDRATKKTRIIGIAYMCMLPVLGILISLLPLNSNAVVELPFLDNTPHTRVFAFAGFPDCATGCPLSISTLRQTYVDYQHLTGKQDIGVIFVNIRHDMPAQISTSYIKSFHQDFEAYATKSSDTKALYTSLALKTFDASEQISQHQGFIYLFKVDNNQWHIEKVFRNNVDKQDLLDHLINHPV